ncbi:Protein PRRC2C [Myotis brandtii]|uniref:Protein PRRC2C n=1 Tax=Myotis brandtii TaxID=109478 RepID=S7MGD5_MYOBR|nr:Protein PRRC2C [Myotis brandtii]
MRAAHSRPKSSRIASSTPPSEEQQTCNQPVQVEGAIAPQAAHHIRGKTAVCSQPPSKDQQPHEQSAPVQGVAAACAKQRAEVLQSTQRFFSEQQQSKQIGGKAPKVDGDSSKPPEALTDAPGVCQEKVEEKPPPAPTMATKPVRTGPIKPQAIKSVKYS